MIVNLFQSFPRFLDSLSATLLVFLCVTLSFGLCFIPHSRTVDVRLVNMVLANVLVPLLVANAGRAIFDFDGPAARGSYFGLTQRLADCATVTAVPFFVAAAARKFGARRLRQCVLAHTLAMIVATCPGSEVVSVDAAACSCTCGPARNSYLHLWADAHVARDTYEPYLFEHTST
jgi:hypothetical protein